MLEYTLELIKETWRKNSARHYKLKDVFLRASITFIFTKRVYILNSFKETRKPTFPGVSLWIAQKIKQNCECSLFSDLLLFWKCLFNTELYLLIIILPDNSTVCIWERKKWPSRIPKSQWFNHNWLKWLQLTARK